MPRKRPPGSALSLSNALLCIILLLLVITAAQQQRPNNAYQRSPPEVLDGAGNTPDHRLGRSTHTRTNHKNSKNNNNNNHDNAILSTNERALATFAPAGSNPAVRAVPARSSAPSAGLTSRHPARSLQDWQVEDIILLATVDGKIHARDRKTGAPRWELEADRPMVETTYHRNNKSTSSEVPAEGDYLWIVEPSQDGSLYVYSPGPRVGMQKLGLTVKQLVEELSPYAGEDPPVVYTADKKNTLYTVDAATGNVLKMFSASGSVTNDDRNCRRVDALEEGLKNEACGSVGTLTLGRTEYTVAIQDRETGEPICTIRYFEWGPNIRDKDLHNQYASTLDNAYVYSKHDGSIFAWDHTETDGYSTSWPQRPMYRHKFSSPVARVYDVVRQYDDDSTDASLVILPQPIGPTGGLPELTTVFVNCTESGSWYALSEQSYPTVTDGATRASCYYDSWYLDPDGEDIPVSGSVLAKQRAKLVGVHPLSALSSERPNIPTISGPEARDTISLPAGGMFEDGDLLIDEPRRSWLDSLPPTWTIIIMLLLLVPIIQKKFPSLGDKLLSSRKHVEQLLGQRAPTAQMLDSVPTVTVTEPDDKPASDEVKEETPSSEPPKIREAEPAVETVFAHADKPSESELEPTLSADDDTAAAQPEAEATAAPADTPQEGTPVKPKKKATRGVRGGKKQKEKKALQQEAQQRKRKDSQLDKISDSDVEALTKVESHKDEKAIEVISVPDSENPNFKGKIQINNLVINTDRVLGHGSAGTCVFEGSFEGDPVAVKRMLSQYYELASSEVSFLKQSDYHPNVVRYFCQQRDQHFLYIAVELCQASLWDLYYSDTRDEQRRAELSHLLSIIQTDVPKALHQLAAGLHHLHEMRIIHRDIKPQNILIAYPRRNQKLRLVISDFGLCKTLPENVSTLVDPTSNAGTCGWKAPELILQPKDSASNNGSFPGGQSTTDSATGTGATSGVKRAADIFSLGCLFFWVLTGGSHPFDDKEGWMQMRELNIKKNRMLNMEKLFDLGSDTEEPLQLIRSMLAHEPENRPTAHEVYTHPFFWSAEKRLRFLVDCSDHFEHEPRDPPSEHLLILESYGEVVFGADFLRKLDRSFIDTLGKQRKYNGARMLDLLRAFRNKANHYEDMPEEVQRRVGSLKNGGYLRYWTNRFPRLLMACYCVVRECGVVGNDRFEGYFRGEGE